MTLPGSLLRLMIRADGGAGHYVGCIVGSLAGTDRDLASEDSDVDTGEQVAGDFDDDMGDGDFNVDV